MDERELIITIIFSITGILAIIIIICILIWHIRYRKTKPIKNFKHSPITTHRQQYQRSQVLSSSNIINNKRKRRFNTNESTISLSFNPPHLINQNVKNLDKLLATESILHYEDKQPTHNLDRCYTNPTTEPIYTSSSSNLALNLQSYSQNHQINNLQFQFLNELNHVLCLKQDEQIRNPVKYSQSCRQRNDLIPFDYYRSMTPSASSSIDKLFQSTYNRTTNSANATLMRKARLAQLRDDTAILY